MLITLYSVNNIQDVDDFTTQRIKKLYGINIIVNVSYSSVSFSGEVSDKLYEQL